MNHLLLGMKNLTLGIVAALAATSHTTSVTSQPTPTALPTQAQEIIVRSGEYSYSGYTLKYRVRIPKDGGAVTGQFSGVCEGPITGKFAGGEGSKVEGEAKANCKIAIFHYNLKATYSAKLYLEKGQADINWEGEIPYTSNKGSFTANFDPI